MCGIVGVFAFKNEIGDKKQAKKREAMTYLFTEMLQATQIRGKDATGVTALFDDGNFIIQKGGIPAEEFIGNYGEDKSNYNTFISSCKEYKDALKVLVGHCRKSSVGNSFNNANNHPIRAGEIVGVHNGTLTNHEIIFKKLGCERDGTVDSEAIMRLLQVYTKNCTEPFTIEMLTEVACRLDGSFSVIAYNANNPYQVALLRKLRPMELILIRSLQLMIVVSEKIFVDHAIFEFNKQARLYKSGFQLIEKKDVEHVVLPLDNVGIVDLTKIIQQNTLISQVVEKFDTFKCKKYWQSTFSGNTTYNNEYGVSRNTNYNNSFTRNTNTAGKKNEAVNGAKEAENKNLLPVTEPPTTNKTTAAFVGKIYNRELNRYVDSKKADELNTIPAVLLTNNSPIIESAGKVIDSTSKAEDTVGKVLKEVKDLNAFCVYRAATIEVIEEEKEVERLVAEVVTNVPKVIVSTEEQKSTEMSKLAQLAALGVAKFISEEELVEFLGASSPLAVKALPPHALANRIISTVYEKAYYEGLMCSFQMQPEASVSKIIRISKNVIKLFGKVLGAVCTNKQDMVQPMCSIMTELNLTELTRENMLATFSKGDLVSNVGLIELVKIINSKNNGKENSASSV